MTANELRPMRTRQSASRVPVDNAEAIPSYLQRYADEYEAWHAQRETATGQKN